MTLTAQDIFAVVIIMFGGQASLMGAFVFFGRTAIKHWLGKSRDKFKSDLEILRKDHESQLAIEAAKFQNSLTLALTDYQAAIAATVRRIQLKLPEYRKLREITSLFPSSAQGAFTADQVSDGSRRLRDWYYANGNGVLLSFRAQSRLQAGLSLLMNEPPNSDAIRIVFSGLRTQLKEDLGFYNDTEADLKLRTEEIIRAAGRGEYYKWPAPAALKSSPL